MPGTNNGLFVSLAFAHPADGRPVSFTSPYPPDLAHALDVLRAES